MFNPFLSSLPFLAPFKRWLPAAPAVATTMTTARVRVKELFGKDLPGGHSVFTVKMEVRNVAELDAIRNRLLNIRDVVGSRRGQN